MNVLFYEYILRMAISSYSLYLECTDNILYRLITVSVKIVIYSFYTFTVTAGSMKFAVPIWMAEAPASMNSTASFQFMIPPKPMTGILPLWLLAIPYVRQWVSPAAPDSHRLQWRVSDAAFRVYSHSQQGIDEGNTVCTAIFGCAGYFSDVGNVRGELYDKCLFVTERTAFTTSSAPWR